MRLAYAAFGGGGGGGASGTDAIKQLEAAGCTVQTIKALPAGDHSVLTPVGNIQEVEQLAADERAHYQTPAIWGAYTTPLYPAQVVHNLEHGGIFIQYGPKVPQATVDQLKTFYDGHLNATLLAPLPSLGSKIAMGVWTTPETRRTAAPPTSRSAPRSTMRPTRRSSRPSSSRARSDSRPAR